MENDGLLGPAPAAASPVRALSSARAAILDLLRSKHGPATVEDLARETGQHANTVREHLEALVAEGLAVRGIPTAAGRGRPAKVYRASEPPEGSAQYAALAATLAGEIARLAPNPVEAGREAGARWAQESFGPSAGPVDAADARRRVLAELEGLGFGVDQSSGPPVRLVTCPLLSAARSHSDVVCAVHAGLVEEALRLLGRDDIPSRLEPFAEPGACLLWLGDANRGTIAPGAEGTR